MTTLLYIFGCNVNTNISAIDPSGLNQNNFEKTEIIAGASVPADGFSQLIVAVHLKNSDNNPVKEFLPTYKIEATSNADEVQRTPCSTSDNNGVSVCILKSTNDGNFRFVLTNAKIGLSKTLTFLTVEHSNKNLELISSSIVNGTTAQGSKVNIQLGKPITAPNQTTASGYKVMFQTQ